MRKRLYVDVHVLQTFPASCINRGEDGSPKMVQYGGVNRARVSSQAWKKVMRDYFSEHSDLETGKRTKYVVKYVADKITATHPEIKADDAYKMAYETVKIAITEPQKLEKVLFFIGEKQAAALAELAVQGVTDKNRLEKAVQDGPSVDMALFGRMLAEKAEFTVEGSAEVAHAMSTHAVHSEFDFYSAMDDLSPEEKKGAAMLDTAEFNSATYYRYANVHVHDLYHQLEDDEEKTIKAVALFAEAFVNSLPTGKIHAYANRTVPNTVMVNIRGDQPVSLTGGYEKPVKSQDGFVLESEKRLFDELERTERYVEKPLSTLYITDIKPDIDGTDERNLHCLLDDLSSQLRSIMSDKSTTCD